MKSKTVYQTNHLGVYVGPIEAEESPLEPGVFLVPGGCVPTPPPLDVPDFKAACWTGKAWQLLDYFEGLIVYSTANREPLTLTGIGPIPNGHTVRRPEPDQIWKNGRWVDDLNTQLAKLYPVKLAQINDGCASCITSGFYSDGLGQPHRYDSTLEDQVNLTGMILSTLDGLCACTNQEDEKAFREHTAEQLHVVGQDLVSFKQIALQHAEQLKKALNHMLSDKDLVGMKALEWSAPA
ncbi:DUF4376 domain-containing protein [Pseudomonas huanghezhanensis]|uniref:DUF4376 domain-containing protein n=1 Tax=Pseudomonas huanghezhanensis TaxID=3002903 RepID=UPI0022858000|nr:hypothetical protein [Pseudomonas sp. BSw22131]